MKNINGLIKYSDDGGPFMHVVYGGPIIKRVVGLMTKNLNIVDGKDKIYLKKFSYLNLILLVFFFMMTTLTFFLDV